MNAYEIASKLYSDALAGEDGTVDAFGDDLPASGFYVGGRVESLVFKSPEAVDRGELSWFVGSNDARYYGVWVDQRDGRVYFDVSDHIDTLHDALTLGRERGEIAIWDIAEGEEVLCVLEGDQS